MYADLCEAYQGVILAPHEEARAVHLTLFWANTTPAQITIGIRPKNADAAETPDRNAPYGAYGNCLPWKGE